MRRGLLCALALSLLAMAPAHPGDPRKGPPGGGRRWPHSPCSGCFSVLSEEWGSRSQDGEEEEEQGGRVSPRGAPGHSPTPGRSRGSRPPRAMLRDPPVLPQP
ncbi:uncharacterized protein [Heliangelus exortis]|uniref:uncharacterized protein isoform X2 n=1 Tax=Heliangelus exortis TaxID=472823 RepID=UPI003A8F8ABA